MVKAFKVSEIEETTGYRRSCLMECYCEYREKGVQGLVDKPDGGNSAKLTKLQMEDRMNAIPQKNFTVN